MSTAIGDWLSVALYALVVLLAYGLVRRVAPPDPDHGGLDRRTAGLLVVVAASSVLGLVSTAWYDALSRQPALIEQGQVWRLLTSAAVQDGGLAGTIGNLVALWYIARSASRVWTSATVLVLFIAGAIVFNLPATLAWPQAGGGNSGATLFLAGSLLTGLWTQHRGGSTSAGAAAAALVVGIGLLAHGDAHGEAVLAGLAAGALLGASAPLIERRSSVVVRADAGGRARRPGSAVG